MTRLHYSYPGYPRFDVNHWLDHVNKEDFPTNIYLGKSKWCNRPQASYDCNPAQEAPPAHREIGRGIRFSSEIILTFILFYALDTGWPPYIIFFIYKILFPSFWKIWFTTKYNCPAQFSKQGCSNAPMPRTYFPPTATGCVCANQLGFHCTVLSIRKKPSIILCVCK